MNALETRQEIQKLLGTDPDGVIGRKSQAALSRLIEADDFSEWPQSAEVHDAIASSFADPEDVEAFKRCKATGKTDQQCFAVGDNGIGVWGDNTAQEAVPMCAIHASDMIEKWGSVNGAKHQKVSCTIKGKTVEMLCADRLGVKGRIDLNPASLKALGLHPGILEKCQWHWL